MQQLDLPTNLTHWTDRPVLAFDLETTGTDPETDRIVTACAVLVWPDGTTSGQHSWLVNPGVEIPEAAAAVHGVTTATAQVSGQDAAETIDQICKVLTVNMVDGRPIAAYNASFDLTLLHREAARHGYSWHLHTLRKAKVLDPLVIDRRQDRYRRGKRTLGVCCDHYGVPLDNAHEASADAIAAGRLVWKLRAAFPHLPEMSLDELHALQTRWHADWAADFEAFLHRQGKTDAFIDDQWPIRDLPETSEGAADVA